MDSKVKSKIKGLASKITKKKNQQGLAQETGGSLRGTSERQVTNTIKGMQKDNG